MLVGVEIAVNDESDLVGTEGAQAITDAAMRLAMAIAKIDACHRAQWDLRTAELEMAKIG